MESIICLDEIELIIYFSTFPLYFGGNSYSNPSSISSYFFKDKICPNTPLQPLVPGIWWTASKFVHLTAAKLRYEYKLHAISIFILSSNTSTTNWLTKQVMESLKKYFYWKNSPLSKSRQFSLFMHAKVVKTFFLIKTVLFQIVKKQTAMHNFQCFFLPQQVLVQWFWFKTSKS